jgi:hypothetical protein
MSTKVTLNVGGRAYETTLGTLSGSKFFASYAAAPVEDPSSSSASSGYISDHSVSASALEETTTYIFVDRDPEPFKFVLSFLRGSLSDATVADMSAACRAACLSDADYFQLDASFAWQLWKPQLPPGTSFAIDYSDGLLEHGSINANLRWTPCALPAVVTSPSYRGRVVFTVEEVTFDGVTCFTTSFGNIRRHVSPSGSSQPCLDYTYAIISAWTLPGFALLRPHNDGS